MAANPEASRGDGGNFDPESKVQVQSTCIPAVQYVRITRHPAIDIRGSRTETIAVEQGTLYIYIILLPFSLALSLVNDTVARVGRLPKYAYNVRSSSSPSWALRPEAYVKRHSAFFTYIRNGVMGSQVHMVAANASERL